MTIVGPNGILRQLVAHGSAKTAARYGHNYPHVSIGMARAASAAATQVESPIRLTPVGPRIQGRASCARRTHGLGSSERCARASGIRAAGRTPVHRDSTRAPPGNAQ